MEISAQEKIQLKLGINPRRGTLGDANGVIYEPGKQGYYRVRYAASNGTLGLPSVVRLRPGISLNPKPGLPVLIGMSYDDQFEIIGGDATRAIEAGFNLIQQNPADPFNKPVNQAEILTAFSHQTQVASKSVVVKPWIFLESETVYTFLGETVDLTSYIPAAGYHCLVLLVLQLDMTIAVYPSTDKLLANDLTVDEDLQECWTDAFTADNGNKPLWAWRLHDAQATITNDDRWMDVRQIINSSILASGDSYTQYLRLAGRTGGQTAYGGTASGDDLILGSTSHATKGDVTIASFATFKETTSQLALNGYTNYNGNMIVAGVPQAFASPFTKDGVTPIAFIYLDSTNSALRIGTQGASGYNALTFELPSGAGYADALGLSTVSVAPSTGFDNTLDLGVSGRRWKSLYTGTGPNIMGGTLSLPNLFLGGTNTLSAARRTADGLYYYYDSSSSAIRLVFDRARPFLIDSSDGSTVHDHLIFVPPATTVSGTDAVTNAVTNILIVDHISSGSALAGFGTGIQIRGESSTTNSQNMGLITALWNVHTHASRASDLTLSAYYITTAREGIRIRGGASAVELGFFGVTPVARPAAYTQTYATTTRTNNPTATAAFTGIDNAQAGTVYAQLTDLNTLRTDMLMMAQLINSLVDDGQSLGFAQ